MHAGRRAAPGRLHPTTTTTRRPPFAQRTTRASTSPPPSLFIFGLGFLGETLARLALQEGWSVAGTVRSPAKAAALTGAGIPAHALDLVASPSPGGGGGGLTPQVADALAAATHLVSTVAPHRLEFVEGGAPPPTPPPLDPVLSAVTDLSSLTPALTWVAYVSSTSVYGAERGGAWVGEDDEVGPSTPAGSARVVAEAAWRDWAGGAGIPGAAFRAGGIYGPGRSVLDIVASGGRPGRTRRGGEAEARKPTSRVHVADLARGILAAARTPRPAQQPDWRVYNAVDGDPAAREVVVAAARALLSGGEGVEEKEPDRVEPTTGKRVRGERFAALLAPEEGGLLYPSYQEGLAGILRGE